MSRRILVERDVPVQMRDGIKLLADVYRPDDSSQYPVLLQRTPYNKREPFNQALTNLDPIQAVDHGYVVMIQDVRGRYASEGEFTPFFQEIDDGSDTLEWTANQGWCDGNIGMYGGSYVGAVQWLAARSKSPFLKCIVPAFTASDYYEGWTYQGGALQWGFMVGWVLPHLMSENVARENSELPDGQSSREALVTLVDEMHETFKFLPLRSLPLIHRYAPYFVEWMSHPTRDEFWKAISIQDYHETIRVPALNIGGWYDIFLRGTLRNFTGLRESTPSTQSADGSRLLLGPWTHCNSMSPKAGTVSFGMTSSQNITPIQFDLCRRMLEFFDRWLKGISPISTNEASVEIFVMGADQWRSESEWPLARTECVNYYLRSGTSDNTRNFTGYLSTSEPLQEHPDVYLYDPFHPTPTRGGQLCCYEPSLAPGAEDQSDVESRHDVLVYATPYLEQDVEVTGPIILHLWASSSAPDTDFTAKLVDLSPDGFARNLTDGVIRARFRLGTEEPRLLKPGEVTQFEIDLGATSNVFKRGHRIILEISSSNFPKYDRNPNTGHEFGVDGLLQPAMQRIFHDVNYPSHLVLPVIPHD